MAISHHSRPVPGSMVPPGSMGPDRSVAPSTGLRLVRYGCSVAVAGACTAVAGYLFTVNPNLSTSTYPVCILKQLTGIDCPGCGGIRGTYSLLHGDLAGTLDHNLLVLVIVPLLAYLLARYILEPFGVRLPVPVARPWMAYGLMGLMVAFTVVRNVSGTPLYYFNSAVY